MKAAAYVRLSKWDESTTSPGRQREAITRLCEARGWELVRTFEDIDVSGYNGKRRPGFEAMMERLGEYDAIVFLRLDRLARSLRQLLSIAKDCEQAGVQLVATDGEIDTTSAMGRAFYQLRGVFAEFESASMSERLKAMHGYLREQGKWTGGRPPYGFRVDDADQLVPVPEEISKLEDAARRYIAGEALHVIAKDMGRAHPFLIRAFASERVLKALPEDVVDALATARLSREGFRRDARAPLLSGVVTCGTCGALLVTVARIRKANDWGSYGCRAPGHASISMAWLDSYVSSAVLDAIDTGKLVKAIEKRQKRRAGTPASRDIEARLEILERDYYELGIPRDRYLRRREGLLKRLATSRKAEEARGVDLPRELATNLSKRWDGLSVATRRRIIAAVLERVEVQKVTKRIGRKIDPERVRLVWRR